MVESNLPGPVGTVFRRDAGRGRIAGRWTVDAWAGPLPFSQEFVMKPPQDAIPVNTPAFAPWPSYDEDQIAAVADVLRSGKVNYWTGTACRSFETEYAQAAGRRHAIALANGTVALELALHALDIPPGSEVVTTPRTFIASASAAVMRGCTPVLADVDRDSGNLTAETVARVLTPRTRAIIAVHLAGWPCDMDPLMALAEERGLKVIEDCAQANGARYRDRPVGGIGHAGAFSFCQDKIITTGGEGGLLALDDEAAWRKAWAFKDHGKDWDAVYGREHAPGFRWLHESFGTNWRMTEMQAVLGRAQLRLLPRWGEQRRANMNRMLDAFERWPALRVPRAPAHVLHAAYKAYVHVRPECLKPGWTRDRIHTSVLGRGVPCFTGSCSEIYRERAFQDAGFGPAEPLAVARELGETSLMFPVHPTLAPGSVEAIIRAVEQVMAEASA
jgi:dTDP-4-amino-4,6-dideoxygalactose transaminase